MAISLSRQALVWSLGSWLAATAAPSPVQAQPDNAELQVDDDDVVAAPAEAAPAAPPATTEAPGAPPAGAAPSTTAPADPAPPQPPAANTPATEATAPSTATQQAPITPSTTAPADPAPPQPPAANTTSLTPATTKGTAPADALTTTPAVPSRPTPPERGSVRPKARHFPAWLHLSGYLQAQARMWDQSAVDALDPATGEPLNTERFVLRRARLALQAKRGIWQGLLVFDGNTVDELEARLLAAHVAVRDPWSPGALPFGQLVLGLMKMPFGFEVPEGSRSRLILERSNAAQAMFPGNFDLGAQLRGGWQQLRYALGVFNGNPVSTADQYRPRDPNRAKDLIARVGIDTEGERGIAFIGGFSALFGQGFHPGVAPTKDTLVWQDLNEDALVQLSELQALSGGPGSAAENFERFAVGIDLRFIFDVPLLGSHTLYSELVWGNNMDRAFVVSDPVAAGRDLRQFGWHIGVNQELSRHLILGLRYDRYDADRDAADSIGAAILASSAVYGTLAIALAWQYEDIGRLTLQYEHNTNPLGRNAAGRVATLAADRLTLRAQVGF